MNTFIERVELALRQSWKIAGSQGVIMDSEAPARAALLTAFILGRWHRFAKSGFQQRPSDGAADQLALLL